eukprot:c24504_g1_i2 orf=271-1809(+)
MHGGSQRGLNDRKYGQLCQSLLDLELAAENIFNTITNRVSLEHQRLENVKGRIQNVQTQIGSITGTSRAITVFSSPKYPTIPASQQDFIPLFGGRVGEYYAEFPLSTISLSSGQSQNGGDGTFELYSFFAETSCESWLSVSKQKGIGSLPTSLKSIVDAFLFNTAELPYSKYQIVDNLLSSENLPVQDQTSERTILPPPPQSILDCSAVRSAGSEDFGFRPVLGQVPSFTLPPVLPDLPNVAEINWSGLDSGLESLPSIAPSALPKHSARSPPPIFLKDESHTPRSSFQHTATPRRTESLQIPSQAESLSQAQAQAQCPSPPLLCVPPAQSLTPPPIPPPPPLPSLPMRMTGFGQDLKSFSNFEQSSSAESSHAESFPLIDSQRAALLASIRNPNITLRKIGEVEEKTEALQPSKESGNEVSNFSQRQPGILLSEMATALKLRRLSMQGAAHSKEQGGMKSVGMFLTLNDTAISSPSQSSSNISSKITLPIANLPPHSTKSDESDTEDEWDD